LAALLLRTVFVTGGRLLANLRRCDNRLNVSGARFRYTFDGSPTAGFHERGVSTKTSG
jgi:hypothetical protein